MNSEFDKWVEESAPQVEVNNIRKEIHLAVLQTRLRKRDKDYRRRQNRFRRGSILSLAMMFIFIGGNFSQLGSDGFDFVVTENEFLPGNKSLEIGFRKASMGGPCYMTDEVLVEISSKMEAGERTTIGVESVTIHGKEFWSMEFEVEMGNFMVPTGGEVNDRLSEMTRDHLDFMQTENQSILRKAADGTLKPSAEWVETIDGCRFLMKEYNVNSKKYGFVKVKLGQPIR